jgi:uncharacterized protein (DUF1499 family)
MNKGHRMVVLMWSLIGVVVLLAAAVLAGQLGLLQGRAPANLGVREGRLKPPAKTPNSVTSQAALYPEHPMRDFAQIAPLALRGDGAATLERIQAIVEGMAGARVVKTEPGYLYAQFTTPLMKFVDDVEFWFDPSAGVVQVRSASRVGHGDRGLNRARVEAIRARLAAAP